MSTEGENIMEQLRRWLRGEARAIDERRLEESAADDPFLHDALDGYRRFPEGAHGEATARLRRRLQARAQRRGGAFIRWLPRAAAAAVALALIGAALWYLIAPGEGTDAAVTMSDPVPEERAAPTPSADQAGDQEAAPTAEVQPVFPPPQPPPPAPAEAMRKSAAGAELAEAAGETPEADDQVGSSRAAAAPAPAVSGRVTDTQGAPVEGAAVILPGAAETKTDTSGAFALTAPADSKDLLINRPGYQPALVPAAPEDSLLIVLEETKKEAPAVSRSQQLSKGVPRTARRASPSLARPVGGMPAFEAYLRDHQPFEGPDSSAIVLLQFTVRPDSTLHNFQVLHSSDSTLHEEAIRLLRDGPKWIPLGEPPVIVRQPIVFEKKQ